MRIYLVRHGERQTIAGLGSAIDCGISDLGHKQSAAAAVVLAKLGVDCILSSPYRRCLETAETIRSATAAAAEIWPVVHEHHPNLFPPGPWPLPTKRDLALRWPNFMIPAEMPESRWAVVPEDSSAHWERISGAFGVLLERFRRRRAVRVVVVTHEASASLFVQAFCRLEKPLDVRLHVDPASITILEVEPADQRHVVCLNWQPEPKLGN